MIEACPERTAEVHVWETTAHMDQRAHFDAPAHKKIPAPSCPVA
jgi:hypothetical protein